MCWSGYCCIAFWHVVVLRFRQRKRQPVRCLWRKGLRLVYKGGTTSSEMKHLRFWCTCNSAASLPNERSESAGDREVAPSKESNDLCSSGKWHVRHCTVTNDMYVSVRQENDMYRQLDRCSDRWTWKRWLSTFAPREDCACLWYWFSFRRLVNAEPAIICLPQLTSQRYFGWSTVTASKSRWTSWFCHMSSAWRW